jgi:hypothetical protein
MSSMISPKNWGLLERRSCLVPTLRGWLLLLIPLAALFVYGFRNMDSFLTLNDPVPGGVLVVEGWSPDYAFKSAMEESLRHPAGKLYVIGGPLDQGAGLSEFKSSAELGAAILIRMGMKKESVQAVPAPYESRDRTFSAAVALYHWLSEHKAIPRNLNIISVGAHARRSHLLFQEAFGSGTHVGVIALNNRGYDGAHWWRSSAGVRSVVDETVAYCYARALFIPHRENYRDFE